MNKIYSLILLLFLSNWAFAQEPKIIEGLPSDLDQVQLILLKHEAIEVGSEEEEEASREYVMRRQENHNRVLKEFNRELEEAAKEFYPFDYLLAFPSEVDSLLGSTAKYVLYSNVYQYNFLKDQPEEGELLVFGYYLKDKETEVVYQLFELDEMKVYDAKLIMKKLAKDIKKNFPNKD